MSLHKGGCHCGKVTFEVETPTDVTVAKCNCSMCSTCGFIHLIVEKDKFKLLSGQDDITTYTFNTHTAKHKFCRHCGIKSFYVPRSHPEGISVNLNSLDLSKFNSINYKDFDGDNWEQNVSNLRKNLL